MLLAGAPKDRDGGICESPLPYPLDSNSSTEPRRRGSGGSLRRVDWAAAGLQGYRNPVSVADCLSPLRRNVWVLCVRLCIARVSGGLVGHISLVFHYWVKKKTLFV